MKNRKCNLYITGGIAIIGIIGLVILQLRCYELIGIHGGTRFLSDLRQLGIAIMGGLFTSACVTFLISISEYKNERKEALENVYFAAEDLEREFCSFKKSVQITLLTHIKDWTFFLPINLYGAIYMKNFTAGFGRK